MNHNTLNKYNTKYCTNCGLYGHNFKNCHNPILSYGIILFKINLNAPRIHDKILILLLQRKHTYSYMDFIRGKYNFKNAQDINKLKLNINNMTITEVNNIIYHDFDTLWCRLWNIKYINELNTRFKKEYKISKDKFYKLKKGYISKYFIHYLKNIKNSLYKTPEYGFAKGRRNYKEHDLDCAIREFTEETNYTINDIEILNRDRTFNENYIALNNTTYEHKYYIALCNSNVEPYIDDNNREQTNEVNSIKWCSLSKVLKSFRKYEKWKFELIKNSFTYFLNYIKLYKKINYP
jgi:8-oxo-dGTP pyrophosphatase MutT (NUDIX family)